MHIMRILNACLYAFTHIHIDTQRIQCTIEPAVFCVLYIVLMLALKNGCDDNHFASQENKYIT